MRIRKAYYTHLHNTFKVQHNASNNDRSHSIPHAMWSAKRAVVYMHGKWATQPCRMKSHARYANDGHDLAKDCADALVAALPEHTKPILDDAQKPFEAMRRWLAKPTTELNSAQEVLKYTSI